MSIAITKRSTSVWMIAAAVAIIAALGIFATQSVSAANLSDFGLSNGDLVTTFQADGQPDINFTTQTHVGAFTRNMLNPQVAALYTGLFGNVFENVNQITRAQMDSMPLSCYVTNGETQDGKVYYMTITGPDTAILQHIAIDGDTMVAWDAHFFPKVFEMNTPEQNYYALGASITSTDDIPTCASQETPTTTDTGSLTVSLASTNPASGTLVAGQALADMLHLNFVGSGTVTGLKFERIGVAADTTLSNSYIYEGVTRITDGSSVSSGYVNFNDTSGLFTVNGSKTIEVRSDIAASTSGQTVGLRLVEYTMNGTHTVSVTGNEHTIASATLATVAFNSTTTPSTNSALDPADDVTIWQNTVSVGNREVMLHSLQMRIIGSVSQGDLQNFRLFVNGTQVGSSVAQTDANGYVVFDLTGTPLEIDAGSRIFKVLADVVGGSGDNFTASVRKAQDIYVFDGQFDQPVLATAGGSFPVDAGQQTISNGTLTITKLDESPSGDIVDDASGINFATFEFKANGEPLKVENLRVSMTHSNGGSVTELRNGALFLDGTQIGSTQDILEDSNGVGYTEYSLGSSMVIQPGTPRVLEIHADVFDSDGTNDMAADDTITINLAAGSSNVERLNSLGFISSSAKSANQLTVATGGLTGGKYSGYADQNVVDPATNFKVGHFTLKATSTEDVNVNTITFDDDNSGGTFSAADLTDMYLKIWDHNDNLVLTTSPKATVSDSASNSYSVNFDIPKNKTYQIEVFADVASGLTSADYMNFDMDAAGTTTGSSSSVTSSEVDGQRITAQTGSLTTSNGSIPSASIGADGTTHSVYSFLMQPVYDDFVLEEVYVDLSSTAASSTGAVAQLILKDGNGTTMDTATVDTTTGSASFTGLEHALDQADGTQTFTVEVKLASVGVSANDTGGNVTVRLDGHKYRDDTGSTTTTGLSASTYTANALISHASYPMFMNQDDDFDTLLAAGTKTLMHTKVTSTGGNSEFKKLIFTVGTPASGPTVTESSLALWKSTDGTVFSDVTSLGSFSTASRDLDSQSATSALVSFVFTTPEAVDSVGAEYQLRGTVGGTLTSGNYITTQIANPSTSSSTDDYTTQAATSASVVWSDRSDASHSTTTDDWMGDFLIRGLADTQTLQAAN